VQLTPFRTEMTNSLHAYESWLDTLDLKMVLSEHTVHINFDCPIAIPLSECKDVQGLKDCVARVRGALRQDSTHLPRKYLIERFLRTVIAANSLSASADEVLDSLRSDWNIADDFFDF